MPLSLYLAVIIFFTNILHADQVDDFINSHLQRGGAPGIVLTVWKNGKEIKTAGYGVSNLELDVPATRMSVFELGAISAEFTAAGILLLNEAGKLSLEDPIIKHLPGAPSSWKDITIRQCLTHTSGLKSYVFLDGFELRHHLSQLDFVRLIGEFPLENEPGTKVVYCPTDSTLLGHIISNVSGQSYQSYIESKIFRPLAMNSTYDRNPARVIANRGNGYNKTKDGVFENRDDDLTDMFAAGAIATTVMDMAKWDNALNSTDLFSDASLKSLWTPGHLNSGASHGHGFIFKASSWKGHTEHYILGSTGGFCAAHLRYPQTGLTVIVLANSSEVNLAPTLGRGVADIYLGSK